MNTRGVFVRFIGACVAALTTIIVSGCGTQSSSPSADTEPEPKAPSVTIHDPADYDRWGELNGGDKDLPPEMGDLEKAYGLDELNWPSGEYFTDYVGVARLGKYCVAAFHSPETLQENGIVDVDIMSKYNQLYVIRSDEALTWYQVRRMLNKYRPFCNDEVAYSDIPDAAVQTTY